MRLYLPVIVSHWKQKITLTLVSEKEVHIGSYRICQQSIPLSADTLNSHFNQAAEIVKITENAEKWIWKHELQIRFNCKEGLFSFLFDHSFDHPEKKCNFTKVEVIPDSFFRVFSDF